METVGLDPMSKKAVRKYSMGMRQRLGIAQAIMEDPEVILLDEPFSALDSYLKYQLELELTETLERFPGTILWVSHDRNEVFRNCRRVCVLDKGKSQKTVTLRELFHHPETEAAARLSGCKNYADVLVDGDAVLVPEWGIKLHCGQSVPEDIRRIGIRARHVSFAQQKGENIFPCTVLRVVQDVFTTIILLRPEGASVDAPPLRMEVGRDVWYAVEDKTRLLIYVQPRDILLLR